MRNPGSGLFQSRTKFTKIINYTNYLRWQVRALHFRDDILPTVEEVLRKLEAAGYSSKDQFAVRLALEEALVNAIKHGHKDDPSKEVRLRYQLTPYHLVAEIEDQGPGFNMSDVADPCAPENLERPSGRGLLLMRRYMTSVSFNAAGNCVTLCRRRSDA